MNNFLKIGSRFVVQAGLQSGPSCRSLLNTGIVAPLLTLDLIFNIHLTAGAPLSGSSTPNSVDSPLLFAFVSAMEPF